MEALLWYRAKEPRHEQLSILPVARNSGRMSVLPLELVEHIATFLDSDNLLTFSEVGSFDCEFLPIFDLV